jgi:hypothetical protein
LLNFAGLDTSKQVEHFKIELLRPLQGLGCSMLRPVKTWRTTEEARLFLCGPATDRAQSVRQMAAVHGLMYGECKKTAPEGGKFMLPALQRCFGCPGPGSLICICNFLPAEAQWPIDWR